jgi:hypothetical protein
MHFSRPRRASGRVVADPGVSGASRRYQQVIDRLDERCQVNFLGDLFD